MNEKVSIVVPVYNVEKYIEACLLSLVNQTYNNIEIIIVNDGSTDNSLMICEEYEKKYHNIKLLSIKNQGVSYARNLGMDNSKGDYIICVDSDDIIEPDMIEQMIYIAKEEKSDIVLCGIDFFDTNFYKERRHRCQNYIINNIRVDVNTFSDYAKNNPLEPYFGAPYNKLIKKSIIEENKIYYEVGAQLAEDTCFCYNLYAFIDSVGICKNVLYHHRVNAGASLSRKAHSVQEIQERVNKIDGAFQFFCKTQIYNYEKEFEEYYQKLIVFYIRLISKSTDVSLIKKADLIKNLCQNKKIDMNNISFFMSGLLKSKHYYLFVVFMKIRTCFLKYFKRGILKLNKFLKFI